MAFEKKPLNYDELEEIEAREAEQRGGDYD